MSSLMTGGLNLDMIPPEEMGLKGYKVAYD
jgi:hypothetical protein